MSRMERVRKGWDREERIDVGSDEVSKAWRLFFYSVAPFPHDVS